MEYVFLDNFCIDFVLLFLTAKVVRAKIKWWLLLLASLLGTVVAFVLPLFSLPIWAAILIKIALGLSMSAIVLAGQSFVVNFVGFLMFLLFTFVLGGMTIAFIGLFSKTTVETFSLNYEGVLPVGLLILALFLFVRGTAFLLKYINERRKIAPFLRNLQVQIDGKKIELFGYMDSGNRLEDPETGQPVVVVSWSSLEKRLGRGFLERLNDAQKVSKKLCAHYIEAKTATGSGKMLVFKPDYLHVGTDRKNAVVAVSKEKFSDVVKIDALFGPELV